jgi:3-hydroxybutyryl-CoA dehydrogenase
MLLASLPNQQVDQLNLQRHILPTRYGNITAEIMGHPGTDADVFDTLVAFAKSIGMVALPLKEQPGYIVNSLLVPLLCRD